MVIAVTSAISGKVGISLGSGDEAANRLRRPLAAINEGIEQIEVTVQKETATTQVLSVQRDTPDSDKLWTCDVKRYSIFYRLSMHPCGKGASMINAIDLTHDLKDLVMLKDRYGHSTDEASLKSFAKLSNYRDGGIFAAYFSGSSGWERHPKGDEVVQSLELSAGMMVVVPQGCWHRFESETGVKVMTTTPKPTEHTHVDDPKTEVVDD